MVHVHGRRVQQQVAAAAGAPAEQCVVVAIDTGKADAVALVADFTGERLCAPVTFTMNRTGVTGMVEQVVAAAADRQVRLVRCGVEASGYHLPLLTPGLLPAAWTMVELNPAHVAMQRRVNGQRSVKTDLGRCHRHVRPAGCWPRPRRRPSRHRDRRAGRMGPLASKSSGAQASNR